MGISFKLSKKGTRYQSKLIQSGTVGEDLEGHSLAGDAASVLHKKQQSECAYSRTNNGNVDHPVLLNDSHGFPPDPFEEVSFALNLLPNGFSIGMPTENGKPPPLLQDVPKLLHPYDRASEALFSAIEVGILPGDLLDEIPCKYRNGTLICEIRDYRKCVTTPGNFVSGDGSPIIHRVQLRMSMENVVKDIPSITDSSWTYGDLLEVESRIVKALQPVLHLDPAPMLDRPGVHQSKNKLDLGISQHRKRLRQSASVQVVSHSLPHGKKISIDRIGEIEKGQFGPPAVDGSVQHLPYHVAAQSLPSPSLRPQVQEFSKQMLAMATQSKDHPAVVTSKSVHDQALGVSSANVLGINAHYISGIGQDSQNPYKDQRISSVFLGKRDNHVMQMQSNFETKRPRQDQLVLEGIHHPPIGSQVDYSLLGVDASWKSTLQQQQQQLEGKRLLNTNVHAQKHQQEVETNARQTVLEGIPKAETGVPSYSEAVRNPVKVEQPELVQLEKQDPVMNRNDQSVLAMLGGQSDARLQSQQTDMRFHQQPQWQNVGQLQKKDDVSVRRKQPPNSRVSGGTVNSPGSSKSGEFSSGSLGANYSMNTTTAPNRLQKENPVPGSDAVAGSTSINCGLNDNIIRQQQNTGNSKRKPMNLRAAAVDSPGSVNNPNPNASSPSVVSSPIPSSGVKPDSPIDRFLKLETLVQRYGLNCKKNKADEYHERKPFLHSPQHIMMHLSNVQSTEDVNETTCAKSLGKSLLGGSMNICKSRNLECVRPKQIVQVNGVSHVTPAARYRLCMSERVKDGMVEAVVEYSVEDENSELLSYPQNALPTLPNTNYADLFAAQFSTLMIHDGYEVNDQLQLMPSRLMGFISNGQPVPSVPLGGPAPETACQPPIPAHTVMSGGIATSGVQPLNAAGMSSQGLLANSRAQHPGVSSSMHLQSSYSQSRQQQLDPSQLAVMQQQQQSLQPSAVQQAQYSQLQRSATLNNPRAQLSPVSVHVANQMVGSSGEMQFQMLQQQQQQQQQPQLRKVMGALSGVGMANMGSGMVSGSMQPSGVAGGLGNFVSLGGIGMGMTHMGGPSMSAPMSAMPGLGNVGQMGLNPASNVSSVLRMTPAQAMAAAKLRTMQQNRGRAMLGGAATMRSPIDSLGGVPGSGPMSILGQTLNRTNITAMQRSAMSAMGPPKIPGTNFYMNQQQQFHQLQMQQQQMQLQQQQQMGSPLLQQSLVGTVQQQQQQQQQQQVGSPSGLSLPQQMNQPTPQQPQAQQHPMSPQQMSPSPQLSSNAIQQLVPQQQMVAGGGAGPASPQLSSQTIGSVGSITSSPMDLQAGSKSNSNANAS